ncbi:hypothetical protein IH574_02815 [Candidatus Bathyarchaeota archaeon]|nr:hypothetical protein [Candidatus Bathyarchaeota archaeon]
MKENFREAFLDGDFHDLLQGKYLRVRHRPMDEYQNQTGKLEFSSTSAPEGVSSLPEQLELFVEAGELIMLNSSLPQYEHTQFTDVYDAIPCTAWVNPSDAEKNGLKDGGKYAIYNKHGQIDVTVKITEKVLPGVIWCPRELIDENGNPQNGLAPGIPQKLGGGPMFNTVKVRFKE